MASTILSSASSANERQEKFLRLFLPAHDRLARFARAMTRDRDEARDLIGDTVLIAYEHFDELADPQAFVSWLFTIARRRANRNRGRRKKYLLFGELQHADQSHASDDVERAAFLDRPDPAMLPDDAVDLQLLYDAFAKLPRAQREAVTMFEIAGLSLEEIRAVQGGTLSGVKSRVARGRQKLAALMGVKNEFIASAQPLYAAPQRNGAANASTIISRTEKQ